MMRRPPRSTLDRSSAASDVYKRQSLLRDLTWLRDLLCVAVDVVSVTVAILTGPVYFIFLATAGGQTVGKYVMGVRVVRLDGKPMTYLGSALRWFGYLGSRFPVGLGFFWVVIDDRRRGFHDKIAGTCVIYSWRAQQDEYLLARIRRFFGRASKKSRVALMRSLATQQIELVTFAVPGFNELNDVPRIVKDGVQNSEFEILGFQEYAKSTDGQLNHLESDPMLDGVGSVEGLAGASSVAVSFDGEWPSASDPASTFYFGSAKVRFLRPVVPGEQLLMEVTAVKIISTGGIVDATARVGAETVAEAQLSFGGKRSGRRCDHDLPAHGIPLARPFESGGRDGAQVLG